MTVKKMLVEKSMIGNCQSVLLIILFLRYIKLYNMMKISSNSNFLKFNLRLCYDGVEKKNVNNKGLPIKKKKKMECKRKCPLTR